jgi:hypothetical protein
MLANPEMELTAYSTRNGAFQKLQTDNTYVVQFVVESASVAHGLAVVVPPPQGRRGRPAVGADGALATGCVLKLAYKIRQHTYKIER